MKYLSDYTEKRIEALNKELLVFYAFNKEQLEAGMKPIREKGAKEGRIIKVTPLGYGVYVPSESVTEFLDRMEAITKDGVSKDLAENGIEGVIDRELANHEAYYTGEIEDTWNALSGYGCITKEMIQDRYWENVRKQRAHEEMEA